MTTETAGHPDDQRRSQYQAEVEPRLLLVHFIREVANLTGTHIGCDTTSCGACTVLVNGVPAKSCTMFAVQADGAEIRPWRAWSRTAQLHPVQEGFFEEHGLQCGFCTPGMMMTAMALARAQPESHRGRRYARPSPATSAAAPATSTSSRPSSTPARRCASRRPPLRQAAVASGGDYNGDSCTDTRRHGT